MLSIYKEVISAKSLNGGNVLPGRKLQIDAKNLNFEIVESALYMKSVSMPLMRSYTKIPDQKSLDIKESTSY